MISWWFDHFSGYWWWLKWWNWRVKNINKNHNSCFEVINFQSSTSLLTAGDLIHLPSLFVMTFPADLTSIAAPRESRTNSLTLSLPGLGTRRRRSRCLSGISADLSYRLARHLKDLGILLQPTPAAIAGGPHGGELWWLDVSGRIRSNGSVLDRSLFFRSTKSLLRNWGQIWGLDCHGPECPMACHGMLKMTKI